MNWSEICLSSTRWIRQTPESMFKAWIMLSNMQGSKVSFSIGQEIKTTQEEVRSMIACQQTRWNQFILSIISLQALQLFLQRSTKWNLQLLLQIFSSSCFEELLLFRDLLLRFTFLQALQEVLFSWSRRLFSLLKFLLLFSVLSQHAFKLLLLVTMQFMQSLWSRMNLLESFSVLRLWLQLQADSIRTWIKHGIFDRSGDLREDAQRLLFSFQTFECVKIKSAVTHYCNERPKPFVVYSESIMQYIWSQVFGHRNRKRILQKHRIWFLFSWMNLCHLLRKIILHDFERWTVSQVVTSQEDTMSLYLSKMDWQWSDKVLSLLCSHLCHLFLVGWRFHLLWISKLRVPWYVSVSHLLIDLCHLWMNTLQCMQLLRSLLTKQLSSSCCFVRLYTVHLQHDRCQKSFVRHNKVKKFKLQQLLWRFRRIIFLLRITFIEHEFWFDRIDHLSSHSCSLKSMFHSLCLSKWNHFQATHAVLFQLSIHAISACLKVGRTLQTVCLKWLQLSIVGIVANMSVKQSWRLFAILLSSISASLIV